MPRFNDDIFWDEYHHFSDLSKLEAVLGQLDFTDLIRQIRQRRQDRGRPDWPIEGMLNAVIAQKVLQHRSVSSFRRELKRNPTLMRGLGLPMRSSQCHDRKVLDFPKPEFHYPVPFTFSTLYELLSSQLTNVWTYSKTQCKLYHQHQHHRYCYYVL